MTIRFAALGIDHRHIYGMAQGMIDAGCEFARFWTEGTPQPLDGFVERFPNVPRHDTVEAILKDPSISLILIAAPPEDRAALSLQAMSNGKDVMLDKPGCLTLDQLAEVKNTVAATGRIWSVNFSERFEVPATTLVDKLLHENRIGKVVHILSQGPHRLNAALRPDWFWTPERYGGIIGDIGTHQIDQFLHFAGAETAEVTHCAVGNLGTPEHPRFQDFGEMILSSGAVRGYVRLDWFTPDAAPNWGDGRLTIMGTTGYIEVRKYMDVAGIPGTDHVFLVNGKECTRFDASGEETPYFAKLHNDIVNRTETACRQAHTFEVMRLAIDAQNRATLI